MRTSYLKDLLQRADEALEQAQEASRRMSACQDTLRLICATISVQIDLQTDNESMVGKPKEFRHLFVPTSLNYQGLG